jgi:CHAD domain-containing protein
VLRLGVPPARVGAVRAALGAPRRLARHAGARVEFSLSLDAAAAGAEPRAQLCLELLRGPLAPLFALARHWQREFDLTLRAHEPVVERTAALTSNDAATVVRSWIAATMPALLRELTPLTLGNRDAEPLHQTRVALRRLRTVLRLARHCRVGRDDAWEPQLARTFRALSAARDRDALLEWLPSALQAAGLAMPALPEPAPCAPADIASDPGLHAALLSLLQFALAIPHADDDAGDVVHRAGRYIRRLHARIARDARRFAALSPSRQHAVRKRVKRLRYAVEYCAERMPSEPLRKHLHTLRAAQVALGRLQDIAVASELLRPQAAQDAAAARALRWLRRELRRAVRHSAKALQRVEPPPRMQHGGTAT